MESILSIWPNTEVIFSLAEPLIKNAEGFKTHPYLCPAGKPTIGWGSTKYPFGKAVKLSDKPCTQIEAQVWLECAMRRVLCDLQSSGAVTRAPDANQAGAFLSLAYNIGVGCHDGIKGDLADSTLIEKFNAGDIVGAADEFLKWDKAHVNGTLTSLDGLTRRRQAERALFLKAG